MLRRQTESGPPDTATSTRSPDLTMSYFFMVSLIFVSMVSEISAKLQINSKNQVDGLVKSPMCCQCEEQSDVAISILQTVINYEIASLRSQRRLAGLFYEFIGFQTVWLLRFDH